MFTSRIRTKQLYRGRLSALPHIFKTISTFNNARLNFEARISANTHKRPNALRLILSHESRRAFHSTPWNGHGDWEPPKPGEESADFRLRIFITFIDKDGVEHRIAASKGQNLLTIAQGNDIEMEDISGGFELTLIKGACGGSCSCSTCHVIVEDEEAFDKMPEATDDENDMLDLAFGLTGTSRLGCQVELTKELDGLRVKLPSMTRNLQASDFTNKN
ncbi:Adrenodoxin-like protein, mitochondrial [Golovinomyces cichoracearum]|uniref:Adrenodoxin-like protein, mitochondrial n=1 Tax=Golovinomyces cichoracearum TaxID=62708 RepID=A0A420HGN1_9PEZI|nr:Adrenodoxin-like protein, mitochondrial [Golovinomyces cichoracearum]